MRKTALFLFTALLMTACGQTGTTSTDENDVGTINENQVIAGQVTVDFYDSAVAWSTEEVVNQNKDYYLEHEPDYLKADTNRTEEDYLQSLTVNNLLSFWKVGVIQNGDYAKQTLVLALGRCDGPCPASIFRYAVDEGTGEWTLLLPYSDKPSEDMLGGPAKNQEEAVVIPALDVSESLDLFENDGVYLMDARSELDPNFYKDSEAVGWSLEDFNNRYKVTFKEGTSFVSHKAVDGSSCLYLTTPDGVLVRYLVTPTVFGVTQNEESGSSDPVTFKQFSLQTSEGKTEDHEYMVFAGGCGFYNSCLSTTKASEQEEADLEEVGSIDGRSVYMLKTAKEDAVESDGALTLAVSEAYKSYIMSAQYDSTKTAVSLEEFLAAHSIAFLKLDDGDYTMIYDSDHAPSVECGKPVIYLYPQQSQEVSVQVGNVAFSKTVPAYGQNGWTVWANPNGTLKNLADNKLYPYLFWEGQSSSQVSLGEGWTLAKKDVAVQLPVALAGMGLSSKESADFMEFWLPRLQAVQTPYIQFNFEGTSAMNVVAPLTITPAPDSLLRVFMYYQGVNEAGRKMPSYTAPARSGFSVVEWGGTLY